MSVADLRDQLTLDVVVALVEGERLAGMIGSLAATLGELRELASGHAAFVGELQRRRDAAEALAAAPALVPPSPWGWMGVRGESSRRGYNVGVMAVSGGNLAAWAAHMGLPGPELVGASCFVVPGAADSLDAVVGGPESLGDEAVAWPSQVHLPRIPIAVDMLGHSNGVTPRTWIAPYVTLAPLGGPLSLIEEIASGLHRARFVQMGRRYAWLLTRAGHDLDRLLFRLNLECDQDTGLRVSSSYVAANGKPGSSFWQACYAAGKTFDEAIELYLAFVGEAVDALREGYGRWFPVAWSPAYQPTHVPTDGGWSPGILPYARLLSIHDIACFSYHPSFDRCRTAAEAAATVWGMDGTRNTPALALAAAVEQGKPVACLEHSSRHELDFVLPSRNLAYLPAAYRAFAEFLAANAGRVFGVAALGSPMVNENYLAQLVYPAGHALAGQRVYPATHPNLLAWREMVVAHKTLIGRGTAARL